MADHLEEPLISIPLCMNESPPPVLHSQVDFDGPFPIEGGKQVASVATRYLARLVRNAPVTPRAPKGEGGRSARGGGGEGRMSRPRGG